MDWVRRRCPACDSDRATEIFRDVNRREGLDAEGRAVRCLECETIYLDPAPSAVALARLYGDGSVDPVSREPEKMVPVPRTGESRGIVETVRWMLGELLRGHPHDWPHEPGLGRSILDFGCLDGGKLESWHRRHWRVAGIDLNEKAIAVARARFPDGRFWCGDVLGMSIEDRFDVVRTDNVVEHLIEPDAYLRALVNLLRPGGRIAVYVPNGAALSVTLFGRYSANYWMPFHLNLFTRRSLERLLSRLGLVDVRCRTFTPAGSWTWTLRQRLLEPGFNRRPRSTFDRTLSAAWPLWLPGEIGAQWAGVGEELVAFARKPS